MPLLFLRHFSLLMLFLGTGLVHGQQIEISKSNQALNQVLTDIRDQYQVQISFDDKALSQYINKTQGRFETAEEAIQHLISPFPLAYEKSGEVFIIYYYKPSPNKTYHLSGQVLDKYSLEPLPYSHVLINDHALATDLKGSFTYQSKEDSLFKLKVSHLGYYILDTLISTSSNHEFLLHPSSVGLQEVVIKNSIIEKSTQIGDQAGLMKLNHQVARFLPGYGDNSVFNLLRLQPGILASGEQTNELIIWGSYSGHSKVVFDGFTIFGLKNFNDNISPFNPLIAKDIEVSKGGYDTRLGDRAGGIVNITGKNGNANKFSMELTANNMTLNALAEIPLSKRSTLVVGFRHTYYDLFNPNDLSSLVRANNDDDTTNNIDITLVPDYNFRDLNLKYSLKIKEADLFYVSLYIGSDRFSYSVDESIKNARIRKNTSENNIQSGASIYYGKTWSKGNTSDFSISFSGLDNQYSDAYWVERPQLPNNVNISDKQSNNDINEFYVRANNRFALSQSHSLEFGIASSQTQSIYVEDTFQVNMIDHQEVSNRHTLYVQDRFSFGKGSSLVYGFRANYINSLQKAYLDPRISTSIQLASHWKLNAAMGLYHQYISKSSVVDSLGNYRYIWTICNNEEVPVITSTHITLGTSFHRNSFTFSLEGFFKNTDGLSRYVSSLKYNLRDIYYFTAVSYGLDLMLQKDYRGHSFWLAYSLSKTVESIDINGQLIEGRAPQDQRHELKMAALVSVNPVYFSANYVFGSGFPPITQANQSEISSVYSRLDVSVVYKFLDRKWRGEAGLSVLNVLNTQNIKFANFERVPHNQTNAINLFAEAIPITPTLYLKFSL